MKLHNNACVQAEQSSDANVFAKCRDCIQVSFFDLLIEEEEKESSSGGEQESSREALVMEEEEDDSSKANVLGASGRGGASDSESGLANLDE